MRSFADYRKDQLKKCLYKLPIQEGVKRHFEILKYDLLEAAKLPAILYEQNVLFDHFYDRLRKNDQMLVRNYLEDVISLYKANFLQELLYEASVAAANPFANLETELTTEIERLTDELKKNLAAFLSGTRSPSSGSPSSGSPSSGSPSSGSPSSGSP